MGGCGSGFRGISKATVEDCRSIDATRWQREGFLRPFASYGGRWVWSDPHTKEELASIGFASNCNATSGSVRLYYTTTWQDERIPADYTVRLTTTKSPWGKLRWSFICPLIVNGQPCGRRVQKLYLRGKYFGLSPLQRPDLHQLPGIAQV